MKNKETIHNIKEFVNNRLNFLDENNIDCESYKELEQIHNKLVYGGSC